MNKLRRFISVLRSALGNLLKPLANPKNLPQSVCLEGAHVGVAVRFKRKLRLKVVDDGSNHGGRIIRFGAHGTRNIDQELLNHGEPHDEFVDIFFGAQGSSPEIGACDFYATYLKHSQTMAARSFTLTRFA